MLFVETAALGPRRCCRKSVRAGIAGVGLNTCGGPQCSDCASPGPDSSGLDQEVGGPSGPTASHQRRTGPGFVAPARRLPWQHHRQSLHGQYRGWGQRFPGIAKSARSAERNLDGRTKAGPTLTSAPSRTRMWWVHGHMNDGVDTLAPGVDMALRRDPHRHLELAAPLPRVSRFTGPASIRRRMVISLEARGAFV